MNLAIVVYVSDCSFSIKEKKNCRCMTVVPTVTC